MKKLEKTLQTLGIDEKQVKVYLACLELGTATIQELSEKSGIKRTSIYNFLTEMKEKGFFSEIKSKGKTLIIPEDPNLLIEKAEDNLKNVKNSLPELMGIFNLPGNKPKVKFYQGEEGIKTAYADLVKEGHPIYGFSDYEKMFLSQDEEFLWTIPERRIKKGIKFYCIAKNGPRGKEAKRLDKKQLRETKLVDKINFETEINIYGNKVSMISFRKPYACVIVEDAAIAQTLKSIWQSWWDLLPS